MSSEKQSSKIVLPEAAFVGLPQKVTALVEKESDRGAILILAAYIEEILALVVRAACTSDSLGKELLQFRNPAGDFSSKIMLCEAFGLISPDEAKALNALRKTRNSAAHFDQKGRGFAVLFDSPRTVEEVKRFAGFLNLKFESEKKEHIRAVFVLSGRLLATKLFIRVAETTRPDVAKSLKEMANLWRARMKDTKQGKAIAEAEKEAQEGNPEKLMKLFQSTVDSVKELVDGGTIEQTKPTEPKA